MVGGIEPWSVSLGAVDRAAGNVSICKGAAEARPWRPCAKAEFRLLSGAVVRM
jgi:hypothetical protein